MTARYLGFAMGLAMLVSLAQAEPAGQPAMAMPANMTREPLPAPREPHAIALSTGTVPDMPPEAWERFLGQVNVRNVSHATLTPFLPRLSKATGAAVVVLPGGGFYGLSIVAEGSSVAKYLADHGIAAFVLKYRVNATPANAEDVMAFTTEQIKSASKAGSFEFPTPPQSFEDGQAALRLVRARAVEWHIDPERVGMLGFSAGAILTLSTTLSNAGEKPNFIGLMYPPMAAVDVPAAAPPLFVGIAADDALFGGRGYGLAESWTRAKRPVELHVYQQGNHGFGMGMPGTTTINWASGFVDWLLMNHFLGSRH
jgi:acetyl esterase/lipase